MIAFFLSLPFFFLLNKKTAYYAYKEITYLTIVNHLVSHENSKEMNAITLSNYFYHNLFSPTETMPIDKDVYNDLIRGVAWCDQRSWGLATLLGKIGVANRMIMTRNPNGISNHTVSEVFIAGKWFLLDPMFGLFIQDEEGELLSYADICNNPQAFYSCPQMLMLKAINPYKYKKVKECFTTNIFYHHPLKPIIWHSPLESKDIKRKIATAVLDFYGNIFGDSFAYFYQDIYLVFYSASGKAERLYFKARNYDIYDRYTLARDVYTKFVAEFIDSPQVEDAMFFLALLDNKNKNLEASIRAFNILLEKYPNTRWKRIAYYYLGYSYELLKNYQSAKDYYRKAIYWYNKLSRSEMMPTEFKVVERLYYLLD